MLGFWLCQFNAGSLACGLCLSSWTEFFVWLLEFNICIVIIKPMRCTDISIFFVCGEGNRPLHVSDRFPVHHQESSTIYVATGICHTVYADCLVAGS